MIVLDSKQTERAYTFLGRDIERCPSERPWGASLGIHIQQNSLEAVAMNYESRGRPQLGVLQKGLRQDVKLWLPTESVPSGSFPNMGSGTPYKTRNGEYVPQYVTHFELDGEKELSWLIRSSQHIKTNVHPFALPTTMSSFFKTANFFGQGTVEVNGPKEDGYTRIRRLQRCKDRLITQPFEGIDTVYDVVAYAARTHGTRDAFGYRDILGVVEEEKEVTKVVGGKEVVEKKKWKYFHLSDYKYLSYLDVQEAVSEIGRAFIELGITQDDVVNVYSSTSANWQLVSFACCSISTPIATAYDSLGEAGLQHSLDEPQCAAIFTNADLLPTVAKVAAKVTSLRPRGRA
ncbi:hypothetical protein NM688_g5356 [Phlebia brevispora]|uniref:Uncharacterized protein n=1 Tax=Phlebia brevispora TaxID=194682 RepID=A0ACC1SWV7_9APHY|nr:hypothetical protein NM688_g5356 [Phlebia brevispora]